MNDPYSETATLPNSKLFAPVVDLFLEVEELKNKVAKCDAIIIRDYIGQMYIPHSQLIEKMLVHSKSALLRIRQFYDEFDETLKLEAEMNSRLGGPYGEFMRHSVMSFTEIRLDLLSAAMSGLGCDEELIVEVICLCDQTGLKDLQDAVSSNSHRNVSRDKIIGKTKKDSQLQKFFLRALRETRDEEGPPDYALAKSQMMLLHEIATSKTRNANEYLDILIRCSRTQCAAIAEAYQKEHNFSLESSIQSVFRGICGRAITLWTMPLLDAVAYEIRTVTDDTTFRDGDDTVLSVARLMSLMDKHQLVDIEQVYQRLADESLVSVLDNFAYGNIRSAMYARFEKNYIDGGAEVLMNDYVLKNGGTMYSTFVEGHSIAQMTGFLTEMKNKYSAYLDSEKGHTMVASEHVSSKTVDEGHTSEKDFGREKLNSSRTFTAADRAKYKEEFLVVSEFLKKQFYKHDFDRSGALDSVEFWTFMNQLDLGLSAKDIEVLKQRNDWDRDGYVSFQEASHELVDTIMTMMELQGKNVKAEVGRLKTLLDEDEAEEQETATEALVQEEALPPKLPKYLKASFEAYDIDKSGYLDRVEFWKFMRSIFTDAFTDYDIEQMQVRKNAVIFIR